MSTVTVSTKRNRVYQRKFDHDEARALRADGWNWAALARRYDVTREAVRRVCDDEVRARMYASQRRNDESQCPDCGAKTTRGHRCYTCAAKLRATSVRPDTLRCFRCDEWKPDDQFPSGSSTARRGRHNYCRPCGTTARREYRHRHREATRAYDRAYRARRREQAAA